MVNIKASENVIFAQLDKITCLLEEYAEVLNNIQGSMALLGDSIEGTHMDVLRSLWEEHYVHGYKLNGETRAFLQRVREELTMILPPPPPQPPIFFN